MPTFAVRVASGIEAATLEVHAVRHSQVHRDLWISQIEVADNDVLDAFPLGFNLTTEFGGDSPFLGAVRGRPRCGYRGDIDRGGRGPHGATSVPAIRKPFDTFRPTLLDWARSAAGHAPLVEQV